MLETLLSTLSCGIVVAYFIFIARFWFRTMRSYSNLVKYEYENLPEQWRKDGEPEGMVFWRAPKHSMNPFIRMVRSNPAMTLLPLLFRTPDWVKDHPEARENLAGMRKNTLWWNLGVLGFPLLFILLLSLSTLWIK